MFGEVAWKSRAVRPVGQGERGRGRRELREIWGDGEEGRAPGTGKRPVELGRLGEVRVRGGIRVGCSDG